ncbi:DUF190 domain-containing protein [Actinopolymorpha pittospori]
MNPIEGPAKRLSVFVDEDDLWHHRPVYAEIVSRAREAGLAGATVIRGIEGYGASRHLHTGRFLSLSEDLPLTVIIVDVAERIEAFLPGLDELLVNGGLVIVEDVEVVRYVGRQA